MPSIEIHMNLLLIPVIVVISAFIGFLFRSSQIASLNKKVASLENEMLWNHAEILNLEKEIVRLNSSKLGAKTPVVSIKDNNADEKSSSKRHM